jgi:hypothetical protein
LADDKEAIVGVTGGDERTFDFGEEADVLFRAETAGVADGEDVIDAVALLGRIESSCNMPRSDA